MGLIDDILKGLPENALLRAQMRELADKYAALETENAILKDDIRKLQAENERLTAVDALDEMEIKILILLANPNRFPNKQYIATELGLDKIRLEYFLKDLSTRGYIYDEFSPNPVEGEPVGYYLQHHGKEYLIKNKLV
jgi:predicted nuclease with TOPRIM domain